MNKFNPCGLPLKGEVMTNRELQKKIDKSKYEVCGTGWSVELINGKYILGFISGSHGGGSVTCEISEEDMNILKEKPDCADAMIIKYCKKYKLEGW